MSTRNILFLLLCLAWVTQAQVANLTFQVLSQGENVEIALEDYFQNASSARIIDSKSSKNYQEVFQIKNSSADALRNVFTTNMTLDYNNQKITLSKQYYHTVKSIYNQPVKLFLLTNNFLMLLIYSELCGDDQIHNQVKGFNLTQNLPPQLKNKKISCTSLETQSAEYDFAYVACRVEEGKGSSFIVQEIKLLHNIQGFIDGLTRTNLAFVVRNTTACSEYSLKYFETMKMDKTSVPSRIFMFCKKVTNNNDEQSNRVYYFYSLQDGIVRVDNFKPLADCLINSSYTSPIDNGFISVINKQMYEYTTTQTDGRSSCQYTGLRNINFIFAASRTYNNIQITYFFLQDNSVMIKSSYRTNYQKLFVNCSGFSFTSYALTERLMAITLANIYGDTRLFIYEMEELYPRLIDNRMVERNSSGFGNLLFMSTSNYLEKGLYVFFFNNATNQLSLKQYSGYTMTIKPRPTSSLLQSNLHVHPTPTPSPTNTTTALSPFSTPNPLPPIKHPLSPINPSPVYTLYVQSSTEKGLFEYMLINISIRKFNDSCLEFVSFRPLGIESSYVNFNLSALALGPLQRFYLEDNMSDHNIHLQFINYFHTIDISSILDSLPSLPSVSSLPTSTPSPRSLQNVKQIALNLQLKVLYPVFTLYYSNFIQNCVLNYHKQKLQFAMECNPDDVIRFKSSIQYNLSKILVLAKDKWLQYSNQSLEFCTIVGEIGQCQLMSRKFIPEYMEIKRIKLVKFQAKSSGNTQIQLFIICNTNLYYGTFKKQNTNKQFTYSKIFTISQNEVQQLTFMQLTNIHYDKGYSSYLLLHLSTADGNILKHMALLYDHPTQNHNGKFLGHLIRKFDDQQIQSIMTIDNLLIILYRMVDGSTIIREYRITEIYSVFYTRKYPLYGRRIVQNGTHVSDGEFLYIQVQQERKESSKTQYLVFCPSLSTTNILTHVIPKQSPITFLQEIGGSKAKYPHSIGIHGKNIFALSIPNLVMKFDYDEKRESTAAVNDNANDDLVGKKVAQLNKGTVEGNLDIKLVDYQNIMHEITYKYEYDISAQTINYTNPSQQPLQLSTQQPTQTYVLDTNKIVGPVMQIQLDAQDCKFLNKPVQFEDVFTKMKCLIDIDSKMYGTHLDLAYVNFGGNRSVEVIITTDHFLCVEDREITKNLFVLPNSKACTIVSFEKNIGLFVCDEGQGSVINLFHFQNSSCLGLTLIPKIQKPAWLIYQYFKMKFVDPFVIFQVPIRVQSNKIYFLTKFNLTYQNFSDKFSSLTFEQYDNFQTKDIDICSEYFYLVEDGLGIYDLKKEFNLSKTNVEPTLWLTTKQLQQNLNTTSQIVYIKPKRTPTQTLPKCPHPSSTIIPVQLGTTTHAYQSIICFLQNTSTYQLIPYITYKQYKDCKNNVLSKSKYYGELTVKLCVLEMSEYRIFSNYMPITPKSSEYYMQFYSVDWGVGGLQTIYPFRMEKISTNDTFEIKEEKGELIVRSLFNFICYYKLTTKISWTLTKNQKYKQKSSQKECNATVSLKNENFIKKYNVLVRDTDPDQQQLIMPWIYRSFFLTICLVSVIKLRIYIKNKNIKLNKMRYNLVSNQFQFKVRLNSKKEIQAEVMSELDSEHGDRNQ